MFNIYVGPLNQLIGNNAPAHRPAVNIVLKKKHEMKAIMLGGAGFLYMRA